MKGFGGGFQIHNNNSTELVWMESLCDEFQILSSHYLVLF